MERVASAWKNQNAETFKNFLDNSELSTEQREKLENSQSRGYGTGVVDEIKSKQV